MADAYCVKHFDQKAVGNCSACNKPFCAECLDVETAQPICPNCKQLKAKEALKASLGSMGQAGSPLNFRVDGMDDDPLGLFGGKSPAKKAEPPKPAAAPFPAAPSGLPMDFPVGGPAGGPQVSLPVPPPKPAASPTSNIPLVSQGLGVPAKPPGTPPVPGAKASMDLDSLLNEYPGFKPTTPKLSPSTSSPGPTSASLPGLGGAPSSSSMPFKVPAPSSGPSGPSGQAGLPQAGIPQPFYPTPSPAPPSSLTAIETNAFNPAPQNKFLSFLKMWAKFLLRRTYGLFEPIAKKIKVPTYLVFGPMMAIFLGAVVWVLLLINQPPLALVDDIQPIHFIQVNSSQISEMDITAYTDLQNQLQTMGFQPVLQMTIPQLPSTNFFDVAMKEDAQTYSEIIKTPGQITPHLSFVTVFTNGVWFSTNNWPGTNQSLDFLWSEFYPSDTPDQLYVHHIQTLEKLKKDKNWQPIQSMGENRYIAAFSDQLRWYLSKKNIPAFQADISSWH